MDLHTNATVTVTFSMEITEAEARALERIAGYSPHSVASALENVVGDRFSREHGGALAAFFKSVGSQVSPALGALAKARDVLRDASAKATGQQ